MPYPRPLNRRYSNIHKWRSEKKKERKKDRQHDIQATYFLILFITRTANEGKEVDAERGREKESERVSDIVSQTHSPNRFLILLLVFFFGSVTLFTPSDEVQNRNYNEAAQRQYERKKNIQVN